MKYSASHVVEGSNYEESGDLVRDVKCYYTSRSCDETTRANRLKNILKYVSCETIHH